MIKKSVNTFFNENLGYKVLATLMTLILWISVLIRRDFVIHKEVPLKIYVQPPFEMVDQTDSKVDLKLEGPRNILFQFSKDKTISSILIPIENPREGLNTVLIHVDNLKLPPGIKVNSMEPTYIKVNLVKK